MPAAIQAMIGSGAVPPVVLTLVDAMYIEVVLHPDTAEASFTLNSDGSANGGVDGSPGNYDWVVEGNPSDYEVVVALISGTFSSGTAGTFGLQTTRTWTAFKSGIGFKEAKALFKIRKKGSSSFLAQATITLRAAVEFG